MTTDFVALLPRSLGFSTRCSSARSSRCLSVSRPFLFYAHHDHRGCWCLLCADFWGRKKVALKWGESGDTDSSGSESPQVLRTVEEAEELVAREVEVRASHDVMLLAPPPPPRPFLHLSLFARGEYFGSLFWCRFWDEPRKTRAGAYPSPAHRETRTDLLVCPRPVADVSDVRPCSDTI